MEACLPRERFRDLRGVLDTAQRGAREALCWPSCVLRVVSSGHCREKRGWARVGALGGGRPTPTGSARDGVGMEVAAE